MYQIFVGSELGINDEILDEETKDLAEIVAQVKVQCAKITGQSMITSVFDVVRGVVVSGFATENLEDDLAEYPQIAIM